VIKIVKYPAPVDNEASDQGVGPHYDAGFLTFVRDSSPSFPALQFNLCTLSFFKHHPTLAFKCKIFPVNGSMLPLSQERLL
jgi:hypothetical protein